eukprot:Rmarinus@m.9139
MSSKKAEPVAACQRCAKTFGLFTRRNFCASCADTCCSACVQSIVSLHFYGLPGKQRVCTNCDQFLKELSADDAMMVEEVPAGNLGPISYVDVSDVTKLASFEKGLYSVCTPSRIMVLWRPFVENPTEKKRLGGFWQMKIDSCHSGAISLAGVCSSYGIDVGEIADKDDDAPRPSLEVHSECVMVPPGIHVFRGGVGRVRVPGSEEGQQHYYLPIKVAEQLILATQRYIMQMENPWERLRRKDAEAFEASCKEAFEVQDQYMQLYLGERDKKNTYEAAKTAMQEGRKAQAVGNFKVACMQYSEAEMLYQQLGETKEATEAQNRARRADLLARRGRSNPTLQRSCSVPENDMQSLMSGANRNKDDQQSASDAPTTPKH